ncbi:hypothetical protein VF13_39015, partial [Nostoc linckia z16]
MALNPNFVFLSENLPTLRIAALQGGTRSGKTYSALQYLIDLADAYSGLTISIVRESFPALRATALRDFIDIMESAALFDSANESKPQGYYEYTHNGNLFEFFSVDNQQKVRGRKRDILYINEANEITLDKFRQLAFRTTGRMIIDYNPSEPESYIYDHVLTREDCGLIITSYLDNPHLPPEIVAEIELLRDADEEYWKVFGEGERGKVSGIILNHYKVVPAEAWPEGKGQTVYGVDFGYNAPSAVVEVKFYDNAIWLREKLYKRKLTNPELIQAIKSDPTIDQHATFYCDAAEPDRIEEFKKAGLKAEKAVKDITDGLDSMRAKPLNVHEHSSNLIGEIKGY